MNTITITHDAVQGTLLTGDPRPHQGLIKPAFRWSRNIGTGGAWYIRASRPNKPANMVAIDNAAWALRDVGFTVVVKIEGEPEDDGYQDEGSILPILEAELARIAEPLAPSVPDPKPTDSEKALARFPQLGKAQLDGFDPYFPVFGPPEPVAPTIAEPQLTKSETAPELSLAERWAARAADCKPMAGDADLLDEPVVKAVATASRKPEATVVHESTHIWIDKQTWDADVKALAHKVQDKRTAGPLNPITGSEWVAWAAIQHAIDDDQPNGERLAISRDEARTLAPVEPVATVPTVAGPVNETPAEFIARHRAAANATVEVVEDPVTVEPEPEPVVEAEPEPVVEADVTEFATPTSDDPRIAKLQRQKAEILRKLHTASSSVHEATLSAALAKINEELAA